MAKSKKPRKPYRRPDFSGEAARLNPSKYGHLENVPAEDLPYKASPLPKPGSPEHARMAEQLRQSAERADAAQEAAPKPPRVPRPRPTAPRPKRVRVDKEPVAPAHPHVTVPSAAQAPRRLGRYLVPVAAGAGVVGGTAFLARRAERRNAEMAKGLIDPVTGDSVRYERAYIDDEVGKSARGVLVAKADGDKSKTRERMTHARRLLLWDGRFGVNPMNEQNKEWRRHWKTNMGHMAAGAAAGAGAGAGAAHLRGRSKLVGGVVGGLLGEVAGGTVARHKIIRRMEASGHLQKRDDMTALQHHGSRRVGGRTPVSTVRVSGLPVQSATFSRGNPEARPGTRSSALRLTHVHTRVKASRGGALFRLGHRSAAPTPVKKGLPMRAGARRSLGMVANQRGAARINDAMRLKESPRVAAARASRGTSGFGQSGATGRRIHVA